MNPIISNILNRSSVRDFTPEKPTNEQLLELARTGMAAPSGINKQPWAFIIINERAILDKLGTELPYAAMLKKAHAAIVVCGDMHKAINGFNDLYWIMDCSAATQNILLAAESMGLASVWTAVYPESDRMQLVSDVLHLPNNIIALNILPIGYPAKAALPKNKWNDANLHWNGWKGKL